MLHRTTLRLAALFLSVATLGRAAEPAAAATPLAAAVTQAAETLPAGGFALAEIENDAVRYASAGRLPAGTAPERLVFEIGSITKVFTGLLLAQASIEGKVALSDPISRHLPADLSLDPSVAAITLEQLSAHTSGLPRLPDNLNPADPMDPYADYDDARLYAFLRTHKLERPAPQPAEYSNLAVGLLGHLLGRAYGVSFGELVAQKITRPLGMNDTVVELTPDQARRLAPPHSGTVAVKPWSLNALQGAGALRSTAADMAKFVLALLDPQSPLAAAWEIARQPRASYGARGQVGLGVMSLTHQGATVYYHGGGTGGFRTHFEVSPEQRRGVVLLLNNDTTEPSLIAATVLRPRAPAPAANAAQVSLSAAQLAEYTGVYAIDARGRFTAVLDGEGQLRLRLTGQAFLPVSALGNDRFAARAVAAEFQFARDDAGRVQRVTLHQGGREVPAERTADAPAILFPSAEKLRDYAGTYELAPGLVFEVNATPLALVVKLTGQPAFPVHNTREDHFVYDVVDAALTFERDASGKVVAVVLHQNGLDPRAPRK